MYNLLYATRLIALVFFTDQSKFKGTPVVVLNWVFLGSAILSFLAVLSERSIPIVSWFYPVFWAALGDGSTQTTLIISSVVVAVVFAGVFGRAALLTHFRTKKRRYLYKLWKYDHGLREYDDRDRDSSRFVRINWDGLKATRITAQGEVGKNEFTRIRYIRTKLDNLDQTLPVKGSKWIIDFDQAKLGMLDVYVVRTNTVEYQEFYARTRIYELVQNVMSFYEFPRIDFINVQVDNGSRISFDSVIISSMEVQNLDDSYSKKRIQKSFEDIFPQLPAGMRWDVSTSNAGQMEIHQAQAQEIFTREEEKKTAEAVRRAAEYDKERQAVAAFRATTPEEPYETSSVLPQPERDVTEVTSEPEEVFKIRELPETMAKPVTTKLTLPPLPPLPKRATSE